MRLWRVRPSGRNSLVERVELTDRSVPKLDASCHQSIEGFDVVGGFHGLPEHIRDAFWILDK